VKCVFRGRAKNEQYSSRVARHGKKFTSKNHLNHSEIEELFKKEHALTEAEIRQLMAGFPTPPI